MIILESVAESSNKPHCEALLWALGIKLPFKCKTEPGLLPNEVTDGYFICRSPRFVVDFGPKKGELPLSWFNWSVSG